jgi:hypothetical protein
LVTSTFFLKLGHPIIRNMKMQNAKMVTIKTQPVLISL